MRKLIIGMSIFMGALSANADVLMVHKVTSDGMSGMGGSIKESKTWIASDKRREEDKTDKKNSTFMSRMAADDKSTITRLDKKLMWIVDAPRKTYQEISLAPQKPVETSESTSAGSEERDEQPEKPTVRISKAEFKVVPGGNKKTVNGFACTDYTVTSLLETENLETHVKNEVKFITLLWTTPETPALAKARQEEEAYAKNWQKAMGIEMSAADWKSLGGTMMAGLMGAGEKELAAALSKMPAEMKKVKGYPIVTRMEWYMKGGDEEASAAQGESSGEEEPLDLSGGLGSALGKLAGKAAKNTAAEKVEERTRPKEGAPLFATTRELVSVSADALPQSVFEVPAGFKKTK